MIRALEEKFIEETVEEQFGNIVSGAIVVNSQNWVIAKTSNSGKQTTGIGKCLSNLSGYSLLNPNDVIGDLTMFATHFPTYQEAVEITQHKGIRTVVCLYPYQDDSGLVLLETRGVKVIIEPITINDILIYNQNVILKRIDLEKKTKSGLIIPDAITQARTRGVLCEVIASDLNVTMYKPKDYVLVDIISCQWLSMKNETCLEDKYFITLAKEILCKVEKGEEDGN